MRNGLQMNDKEYLPLKHELSKEINEDVDSIRFYRLGNSYQNKIDSMGKKLKVEAGEPLLF